MHHQAGPVGLAGSAGLSVLTSIHHASLALHCTAESYIFENLIPTGFQLVLADGQP